MTTTAKPTFSPEELKAILEQYPDVLKNAFESMRATHDADKTDAKIVNAFNKAGFKDVVLYDRSKTLAEQPDVSVLTYAKWMELGRKVKAGEHAVKIRGYAVRLFHKSQTENATVAERKEYFKRQQKKTAKRETAQRSA